MIGLAVIKRHKIMTAALILIVTLLLTINASASDFLGEYCWKMSWDSSTTAQLKLAATDMGSGHFMVNGLFSFSNFSPATGTSTIYGSAEIIGTLVVMSLKNSYLTGTKFSNGTFSLILSSDSFSGSYNAYYTTYDKSSKKTSNDFYSGDISLYSCTSSEG
ncbi:membrane protein [Candidatus Magnetoovum chiemensis]|nr:membrane protein [Candidatus Magnetoovum chiemensis]